MKISLSFFFQLFLVLINTVNAQSVKKHSRDPFEIELANISVSFDHNTGECEKVRINYKDSKDQVIITALDDIFINFTRDGSEKTVYRENLNNAYEISAFEAKHLNLVSKSLLATLEQFEKDLQNNRWGKCLFLDSYFPRFLKGYYYLFCLSTNTADVLPESANVHDSLFDISLNSDKSDIRLNKWQSTHDYIVKLRIATKELIHHIKLWQLDISKKEKNNTQKMAVSKEFARSLGLFVSIYFNDSLLQKKNSVSR